MNQSNQQSWQHYYQQKQGQPPSKLLVAAMEHGEERRQALDLGAGPLIDAQYLLQAGFTHVTAVDADPAMGELAKQLGIAANKLTVVISPIEEFSFPDDTYDLITSHLTLSFLSLPAVTTLLPKIYTALTPGGIFCGDIWGPDDGWNDGDNTLTFLTDQEVRSLLADFEIVFFKTTNNPVRLVRGGSKQSHVHDFIVRKN